MKKQTLLQWYEDEYISYPIYNYIWNLSTLFRDQVLLDLSEIHTYIDKYEEDEE